MNQDGGSQPAAGVLSLASAGRAAYWLFPSLLCLAIYWLGLKAWFRQDDFAWLSLHLSVREPGDLWNALFAPKSFGTIRPLSERGFFLVFHALFGLNALPYRLMVFATQFANLVLLSSVTLRLTGSRTAGLLAPVFWIANVSLPLALCWTSAYNQLLCVFFLLLSLYLLLRYIETERRKFLVWQWITFLLGFGALEVNIVYPALAAAYTLCGARKHFTKTLWMFVPSAVYAAVHLRVAPTPSGGVYAMHFDASVFSTLWTYWKMALGPDTLRAHGHLPSGLASAATLFLTAAAIAFVVWRLRKGQPLALFPLLWFLIVLAPFLPVRDHVSDYYLAAPSAGLAMLGAWAVAGGLNAGWKARVAAFLAAAIYFGASLPVVRAGVRWNYETSQAVRRLVLGVERAGKLHPGKIVLLTGVDTTLFWGGIYDKPFRLVGVSDVYLTPDSDANIESQNRTGTVSEFVLPAAVASQALARDDAVVYEVGGPRLKNVTTLYREIARAQWGSAGEPRRVDAGNPLFADQMGPEWYPIEGSFRWMSKRATVRLGAPRSAGERLYISGYCPAQQVDKGPLKVIVGADGRLYPPFFLTEPDARFEISFPLPDGLVGQDSVQVSVEVERTLVSPSDGRSLGLVFGSFAIR